MSISLRRLLVVAAVLTALTSEFSRAQSQITMPGYPAPGGAPTVTVASAGTEPRTRLRYKVKPGQNFVMVMTTAIGMNIAVEGASMPPMDMPIMKMTMTMNVKDVAANGDITYDAAFTEMVAEPLPGMDPSLAAMVQGAASQITAMKGTVVISDRGVARSSDIDVNKIADPTLRQTLNSIAAQLESLSVPLPEEAVGAGAKWEVRQALNAGGMQMFQRAEVELVSANASSASMRVKIEQHTPPQSVSNPALPAGATMEVEKLLASGSGTMALQFDTLVPTSDISTTSSGVMAMSMGGMSQRMAIDTKVKITVGPRKQ